MPSLFMTRRSVKSSNLLRTAYTFDIAISPSLGPTVNPEGPNRTKSQLGQFAPTRTSLATMGDNNLAQYKYGAMSNLVLQADRRFVSRRGDETTGDPESLAGRVNVGGHGLANGERNGTSSSSGARACQEAQADRACTELAGCWRTQSGRSEYRRSEVPATHSGYEGRLRFDIYQCGAKDGRRLRGADHSFSH